MDASHQTLQSGKITKEQKKAAVKIWSKIKDEIQKKMEEAMAGLKKSVQGKRNKEGFGYFSIKMEVVN